MNNDNISDLPVEGVKCPVCGKTTVQRYKPFCSKRCADVDLNRWLSGVYSVPTNEVPSDADEVLTGMDEKN